MAYHLRKNCDQSSTMETSNPENENIHPTQHIRRIAQHNRAFHLKLYQEHCRGFGRETIQEKQKRDEHPITSNVSTSQRSRRRCDTNKSGIRARRGRVKNENLELAFEVPGQYKFTSLDIDSDDLDFYPTEWLPNMDHANQVMVEREINNKETCQKWINDPYLARLHPVDKAIAAHIQLPASKYIRCKRALIMAACEFKKHDVEHIRRLDARKQLHIDNSKIDAMYTLFNKFGWLQPHSSSF
ncbi:hypothetical protein K492DRAFT_188413 [Lichtheimia hyalospora FSU 10163]|nr:hypothetical protein K492DRAFT_188413 [Lichtheimia hyalospora FSU 10163]